MVILAVLGMPGSGKELLVDVAKELGFHVVRMGDIVRDYASREYNELTDTHVGTFADRERQKEGRGVWAERTLEKIEHRNENLVIDGVRNEEELEIFRQAIGHDLKKIAVIASPEVRFARIKARDREDRPSTWEDFQVRERREEAWGLARAIQACDVIMKNQGTALEFQTRARTYLEQFI